MPTADDLITGKASVDDILGISPKGRENTSIPYQEGSYQLGVPIETDPNMLATPIEGGGQPPQATPPPSPDTTAAGMEGALIRGAGPTAISGLIGAGLGFVGTRSPAGAAMAGRIMAAAPVVGDLGVGMINSMFGTNYMGPTEAFQHLFTKLGVPEPKSAAEHVVMAATRAGSESLATSGAAALKAPGMQQGMGKYLAQSLAENPMGQAAAATTGGAAAETAKQAGAPEGIQALAGFGGALVGAGAYGGLKATGREAMRQQVANAEKQGMVPMTSDVLPPEGMFNKFRQRMRESIPVTGTAGKLVGQQETKIQAAKKIFTEFGGNLDDPSLAKVTEDLLDKRSADLIKYKTMQRQAMDAADHAGKPTVPTPKSEAALKNVIKNLTGVDEYKDVVEVLKGYLRQLQGFKNLGNVEMLRESMGNAMDAVNIAQYKNAGQKALRSVYQPLKDDMEAFIAANGNRKDVVKFKVANRRLYDMSEELKLKSLKMALQNGEVDAEAASRMLFSAKRSDVQALYNGLTPAGRQAARAAIMEKAWENMAKNNNGINPDRFARELKKMGTQVGVMFKGEDLQRAKGFVQAIELLERSGKFALNPPTGVVGQIPMVGGSLATLFAGITKGTQGAAGTIAAVLGTGAMGRIYESPIVRDILLRIPRLAPNDPQRLTLANKMVAAMEAYHATSEDKK